MVYSVVVLEDNRRRFWKYDRQFLSWSVGVYDCFGSSLLVFSPNSFLIDSLSSTKHLHARSCDRLGFVT